MAAEDSIIVKVGIEPPDVSPVEKAMQKLSGAVDTASMSFDEFNKVVKDQSDAVKVVSKEIENLSKEQAKVSRGTEAYEKITARLNQLKSVLSEARKTTISYGEVSKKAADGVAAIVEKVKLWGDAAKKSGREVVRSLVDSERRAELAKAAAIKLLDAYYVVGDGVKKAFERAGKAAVTLGKAFAATGLGAVLGLIASITAKLYANEKVARAMKAVFEAMSNVLQPIVDYIAGIVDKIMSGKESLTKWYDSIGGIKGLFEKLLDFLKSQFEVRLKAIAGVFEGLVNLDFKKVGKNLADAVTGVENTVDRVVDTVKSIGKSFVANAKEIYNAETAAAFLYERLLAIDGQIANLNKRASELNDVLSDGNISAFERLEATKELNKINEELLKKEIEKKQLEYESAKRLHDATVFSEESAKNLAQMQSEINALTKQYGSLVNANAKAVELMLRDMDDAADAFKKSLNDIKNASKAVELSLLVDEYEAARHAINVNLEQTLSDIDAAEEELLKQARINARSREELEKNLSEVTMLMEERRRVEKLNAEKQLNDVLRQEALSNLEKNFKAESTMRAEMLRKGKMDYEEYAMSEAEATLKLVEKKLEYVKKGSQEELNLLAELESAKAGLRDAELRSMEAALNKKITMLELSGAAELKSQYKINKEKFKLEENFLRELLSREDLTASQRLELERRLLENKRNALNESLANIQENFSRTSEMISGVVNGVASAISELTNRAISDEENKFRQREKSLEESVKKGLITQEQADRQRESMEKAMQSRIKKEREKQAKIDKAVAIFNAILAGAQAVLQVFASAAAVPVVGWTLAPAVAAAAAAMTAVQIGIIASTPLPKFRKGVINLDGPGTETSDSIPALLSKGESVMTAEETKKFLPTLMSIRNNAVDPERLNEFATGGWMSLESKLDELTEAVKSKDSVVINVDDTGFHVFTRNKLRDIEWLDKRYRA